MKAWNRLLLGIACSLPWFTMAAGTDEATGAVKRTITAEDGLKIVCETRGRADTALVFLHGWCGDREYWKRQVDVFAPDYRVVTLDQAGHGESGKDRKDWTVESLAGDVESVAKALELKRVIIVGHSMGGPVGLAAAKRMPGRVFGVVGVDTLQDVEFKMPEEATQKFVEGFTTNFQATVRGMFTGLLSEKADPDLVKWLGSRAAAQDPKMAVALMRDMVRLDTKALLAEVKVPVRCINSSGGYQFFRPTSAETNRKYADYKAVFIQDVGHYPMLEKPDEFNRQLRSVLDQIRK